jgi:Helix-turn-helix domain
MSEHDPAVLAERLAELEARVRRLERDRPPPPAAPAPASPPTPTRATASTPTPAPAPTGDPGGLRERFWALDGLKERLPAGDGAVLFCGVVPAAGGWYEWQWGSGSGELLQGDWSQRSAALAALGHPVRLGLLRQVLAGAGTVVELQERAELGTSGQLYHHLRQLVNAGWLRAEARGRYAVPPDRVVPLLVVLAAARPGPA